MTRIEAVATGTIGASGDKILCTLLDFGGATVSVEYSSSSTLRVVAGVVESFIPGGGACSCMLAINADSLAMHSVQHPRYPCEFWVNGALVGQGVSTPSYSGLPVRSTASLRVGRRTDDPSIGVTVTPALRQRITQPSATDHLISILPCEASGLACARDGTASVLRWAFVGDIPARRIYTRGADDAAWALQWEQVMNPATTNCLATAIAPIDALDRWRTGGLPVQYRWTGDAMLSRGLKLDSRDYWRTIEPDAAYGWGTPQPAMPSHVARVMDWDASHWMNHWSLGPYAMVGVTGVNTVGDTLASTLTFISPVLRSIGSTKGPRPWPVIWRSAGQDVAMACITDGLYREWTVPITTVNMLWTVPQIPILRVSIPSDPDMECYPLDLHTARDGSQCLVGCHADDAVVRLWHRSTDADVWGPVRAEWPILPYVTPYVYQRADGLWEVGWLDGETWVQWLSGDPTAAAVDWVVWS